MKKINILNLGLTLLIGLMILTSCEDELRTQYTPYSPTPVSKESVGLEYEELITYPSLVVLKTDTPVFDIAGVYKFRLDTIYASVENGYDLKSFEVDPDHGFVTYNNKNGSILPGVYKVGVSISNATGAVKIDSASRITILEVPLAVTIDNATVEAGALQQGIIATVGYDDVSPDQSITAVTYSLSTAVTGFAIDATTGAISKTTEAASGVHKLSVTLATNLGGKTVVDLVTVTVGPAPTISYQLADGSAALTKVTMSPWTAYTTAAPTLNDMTATAYEAILPAGLSASMVTMAADGKVSVVGDMNIVAGDYVIGVKATNASGASFEFTELFTFTFEIRWDSNPVLTEDFQDDAGNSEFGNNMFSFYLDDAVDQGVFKPILQQSDDDGKTKQFDVRVAKLIMGKNADFADAVMVLPVDLTAINGVKDLRVSFGEANAVYNKAIYERTLGITYDGFPNGNGSSLPADWTVIMDKEDADWASDNWGKNFYYDDFINGYPTTVTEVLTPFDQVSSSKELGGVDGNKTVYICWRVTGTNTNKFQNFIFDDIKVEASTSFTAIEE